MYIFFPRVCYPNIYRDHHPGIYSYFIFSVCKYSFFVSAIPIAIGTTTRAIIHISFFRYVHILSPCLLSQYLSGPPPGQLFIFHFLGMYIFFPRVCHPDSYRDHHPGKGLQMSKFFENKLKIMRSLQLSEQQKGFLHSQR